MQLMTRATRVTAVAASLALLAPSLATADQVADPRAAAAPSTLVTASARTAPLKALGRLRIKGRAPKTGYSRAQFGTAWADVDHNGCSTRQDILRRDVVHATYSGCKVTSGTWTDPYTGITYTLTSFSSLDGDHVVSLSDAWQKGAQGWTAGKRLQFANDPLNIVMTVAAVNRQKSDSDAASWLPPDRSYRCAFIARQVAVKRKYGVWVTRAEYGTMRRILRSRSCARTRLPSASARAR